MTFFVNYEWRTTIDGIDGNFQGFTSYDVDDYESTEKLLADVAKILKRKEATVTFESFDNESKTISRLCNSSYMTEPGKMRELWWNEHSSTANVDMQTPLKKNEIRRVVLESIRVYKDRRFLAA